jgi:hypothetical protein
MIIIGAGMAGLLAARMLAHYKPVVWEAQDKLPNNHSAVLRFRTSLVGDVLGIPFRKVPMIKDVAPWRNPVADALAYSYRNTGEYRSDRSITRGLVVEERYIAPPDLIEQMAEGVTIHYNRAFAPPVAGVPIISTIPMPVMAQLFQYDWDAEFIYKGGQTITALISNCDAYVSLMFPGPEVFTRISITGNQLIIEVPDDKVELDEYTVATRAAEHLGIKVSDLYGITEPRKTRYNKIVPIGDEERKSFMFWLTSKHSIYSLGRYATWRPGLLLDDLVKDIRLIDGWIRRSSNYDVALHRR